MVKYCSEDLPANRIGFRECVLQRWMYSACEVVVNLGAFARNVCCHTHMCLGFDVSVDTLGAYLWVKVPSCVKLTEGEGGAKVKLAWSYASSYV